MERLMGELVTLSTKYQDLTTNSQLAITVWDVSCGKDEGLIGGATIHLFNVKNNLRQGSTNLGFGKAKRSMDQFTLLLPDRAKETPGWVPDFTYEDDEEENSEVDSKEDVLKVNEQNSDVFSDVEGVPETLFEQDETSKKLDVVDSVGKQENTSEDPFNFYPLLKKKSTDAINQEPEVSLKYPPGFTPKAGTDGVSVNDEAVNDVNNVSGYEANVSNEAKLGNWIRISACSCISLNSKNPMALASGGSNSVIYYDVVK
ncbi:nucleotide-binding alpha-beta plait domain-containing protein [Tanacetum coccineum]